MVVPVPVADHVSMVTSEGATMVTVPMATDVADIMADDMDPIIDGGSRRPSFLASIAESAIDYISCRRCGPGGPLQYVSCYNVSFISLIEQVIVPLLSINLY